MVRKKCELDIVVRRAKEGDDKAVVELWQQFSPLITTTVKRLAFLNDDSEAISLVNAALLKAIKGYDPDCGVGFPGYVATVLHNSVISKYRRWRVRIVEHEKMIGDVQVDMKALDDSLSVMEMVRHMQEHFAFWCDDSLSVVTGPVRIYIRENVKVGRWEITFCTWAMSEVGKVLKTQSQQLLLFSNEGMSQSETRPELIKRLTADVFTYVAHKFEGETDSFVREVMRLTERGIEALRAIIRVWREDLPCAYLPMC